MPDLFCIRRSDLGVVRWRKVWDDARSILLVLIIRLVGLSSGLDEQMCLAIEFGGTVLWKAFA